MSKPMTVSEMASKGGIARRDKLTDAQKSAIARKGAKVRWERYFDAKKQAKRDAAKNPLAGK